MGARRRNFLQATAVPLRAVPHPLFGGWRRRIADNTRAAKNQRPAGAEELKAVVRTTLRHVVTSALAGALVASTPAWALDPDKPLAACTVVEVTVPLAGAAGHA
jgi:hypothetical protein